MRLCSVVKRYQNFGFQCTDFHWVHGFSRIYFVHPHNGAPPFPPHLARSLAVHGNQWKGRCTRLSCMYSRAGESTAMHGMFYVHSYQVQNRLTWLVVMSRKQFLYSHHRITNSIELSLQDVIRLQCSDKVWSMSPSSFTCWLEACQCASWLLADISMAGPKTI